MQPLYAVLVSLCLILAIPNASAGSVSGLKPSENQLLPEEASVPFDLNNVRAAEVWVYKSERRLDLLDAKGNPIRSYQVSLGKNPIGNKIKEGDGRTPEGKYIIDARNEKSEFFLSLRLSYPNSADRTKAKKNGISPGGNIFIHGLPNGKSWMFWKYNKKRDWTNGCIAVDNDEIKEIWRLVPDGTPIIIKP